MSDESAMTQEIPADDEDSGADLTAIDRTGHDPLVAARVGAALSVLWWVEGEPAPR